MLRTRCTPSRRRCFTAAPIPSEPPRMHLARPAPATLYLSLTEDAQLTNTPNRFAVSSGPLASTYPARPRCPHTPSSATTRPSPPAFALAVPHLGPHTASWYACACLPPYLRPVAEFKPAKTTSRMVACMHARTFLPALPQLPCQPYFPPSFFTPLLCNAHTPLPIPAST